MLVKRVILKFWVALLSSIFITPGLWAENFSADITGKIKDNSVVGKIFVNDDRSRLETSEMVIITRMDLWETWMLMPKAKLYLKQPFDPTSVIAGKEKIPGELERRFINTELVDGKMTSKYQVLYNVAGQQQMLYQWIDIGLSMAIKSQAFDGSWSMEFKNVKKGKQPDALFEIPEGYKELSYDTLSEAISGLNIQKDKSAKDPQDEPEEPFDIQPLDDDDEL